MTIESERLRILNSAPPREAADYVIYWMQANRRVESNHALAHAVDLANRNGLPLLVYEGLTCAHPAANDRLHRFILEGVPGMAKELKRIGAGHFFYPRKRRGDANDILYKLAARARCVVTDDYPVYLPAAHNRTVPARIGVSYIAVDSSCIVPMSRHEKRAYGAYTIRPKIRRELPLYLKPIAAVCLYRRWRGNLIPEDLRARHTRVTPANIARLAAESDIDHGVGPSISFTGGREEALRHLQVFLDSKLRRYAKESGKPSLHATSGLSPYLHFGHISPLDVALAVREYAAEHRLIADEFLEHLIVRRELAFNFARFSPDAEEGERGSIDALPDWCRRTMAKHAKDIRPFLYTPAQFENADTHDALWNAVQKELLLRGTIHGYYRMYWGKKIIEWSPTYEQALRVMIHLHDVYALDGRDPNTYANILWCFGLHDRPWGERPVFGQLRYMSIEGMRRKTDTAAYISEIGDLERTGKDPYSI
jgi:deoxyribodipyrimidine photo-lyase